MTLSLDPSEHQAILATFDGLDRRQTPDLTGYGLPLILSALALHGGALWLLRRLGIPITGSLPWVMLAITALLILTGIALLVAGNAFVGQRPVARAEAALAVLGREAPTLERRQAAIVLIDNAYYSGGAWLRATFDRDEVRRRLGGDLAYVEAVERFLRQERQVYPVFTGDPPEQP